jgi:hypothetical protein
MKKLIIMFLIVSAKCPPKIEPLNQQSQFKGYLDGILKSDQSDFANRDPSVLKFNANQDSSLLKLETLRDSPIPSDAFLQKGKSQTQGDSSESEVQDKKKITGENSLNASIYLNYAFTKKWEVEFNIDAIGFSFGNAVNAQYQSSKRTVESINQTASPTSFNLLLISDNDLGNLNSEIKIKYYFRTNWAINIGGTFIFNEFTTSNKLFKDNDRFRQKSFVPMIGISYTPFKSIL